MPHSLNLLLRPQWALTFKTVFLVTLASAKRHSKLQAFSHRVQHPEDWFSVTLLPDPLFVAKTERACHPDTRLQEVMLKALAPFVGPDPSTKANNYVVRTVRIYLSRTKAFRRGQKRLFISYKPGHHDEMRHLRSRRGWSRQFAMSMNIGGTRLHISTTSRATIFVLSPLAGTPYRKSPPKASCTLRSGGLTTLSQRSTSSTSL